MSLIVRKPILQGIFLASLLCLLLSCGGSEEVTSSSTVNKPDACTSDAATASYRLDFETTWSAATHPQDFPNSPHFSGLIGFVHQADAAIWEVGDLATTGIKNMAELGSKTPLGSEIDAFIADGSAESTISGGGIGRSPGSVSVEFTVSSTFSLVSVVSMIAPSPDWFVGVNGLDLCEEGTWVNSKSVTLFVYDAGTDSGESYTAANQVTDPPTAISRIETAPFLVNGNVEPVGAFTFTKL